MMLIAGLAVASFVATAQNSFSYQSVIRNNGEVVSNQDVALLISILNGSEVCYQELQKVKTNAYGNISVNVGEGEPKTGSFAAIPWETMQIMMQIEVSTDGTENYVNLGQMQIQPVPYTMYAARTTTVIQSKEASEDPIFEVRDSEGNLMFAVYETGVKVYVDDNKNDNQSGKAAKSKFAVAGRSANKGDETLLTIDAEGTTVYVDDNFNDDDNQSAKAAKSKFAVAGRSAKGDNNLITIDGSGSTIYVNDNTNTDANTKAAKSKFAVAGRSAKGNNLLTVDNAGATVYVDNNYNENDNTKADTKAAKSRFAVAGRSAKGDKNIIAIDGSGSTIYVDDNYNENDNTKADTKAAKSKFAVAGRSAKKSENLFTIDGDGSTVYVDFNTDADKAAKSRFAVAGRSAKGAEDALTIDGDQATFYIDIDNDNKNDDYNQNDKAAKSRFAVAGRSAKDVQTAFVVDGSGTLIYIDEWDDSKAAKSTFAVAGLSSQKSNSNFFIIHRDSTRIYVNDEAAADTSSTEPGSAPVIAPSLASAFSVVGMTQKIDMLVVKKDCTIVRMNTYVEEEVQNSTGVVQKIIDDTKPDIIYTTGQIVASAMQPEADAPESFNITYAYYQSDKGEYLHLKYSDNGNYQYRNYYLIDNMLYADSIVASSAETSNLMLSAPEHYNQPMKNDTSLLMVYERKMRNNGYSSYLEDGLTAFYNSNDELVMTTEHNVLMEVDDTLNFTSNALRSILVQGLRFQDGAPCNVDNLLGLNFSNGQLYDNAADFDNCDEDVFGDEKEQSKLAVEDIEARLVALKNGFAVNVSANNDKLGSVEITGEKLENGNYRYGTTVSIKAIPSSGNIFIAWSNDSIATEIQFVVIEDIELNALFNTPTLYVEAGSNEDNDGLSTQNALPSIAMAIERINEWPEKLAWNISVIGELTDEQEIVGDETEIEVDGDYQTVYSINASSITLTGYDEDATLKGPWNGTEVPTTEYTVLTINTNVPVTIDSITITGGYSYNGGGIYIDSDCDVTIGDKVIITRNKASYGGGIYIYESIVTMNGGTISDNIAEEDGGAIYAGSQSEFSMGGSAYIPSGAMVINDNNESNFETGRGKNDVYLEYDSDYGAINITSNLTSPAPVATITLYYYEYYNNGLSAVMSEVDGVLEANYNKFAVTPEYEEWSEQYTYYQIKKDGRLGKNIKVDFVWYYIDKDTVQHTNTCGELLIVNGESIRAEDIPTVDKKSLNPNPNSTTGNFLGWYRIYYEETYDGYEEHLVEFETTDVLEENTTIVGIWEETIEVSETEGAIQTFAEAVKLMDPYCAYTINVASNISKPQIISAVFGTDWNQWTHSSYEYLERDYKLHSITLQSKSGQEEINLGWHYDENSSQWINSNPIDPAPALTIRTEVPIIIKNLKITGGYAVNGGGIYMNYNDANVTIAEGTVITDNGADAGTSFGTDLKLGGGVYAKGTLTMTGGTISGNTAYRGGGISLYGATFIMTGGTIGGNRAEQYGGGVYINPGSRMYMSGDAVVGDASAKTTATADLHSNIANDGGGIYIDPNSYGSGLYLGYVPDTSAMLTGGIYYNYAYNCGGAVNAQNGHAQYSVYSTVNMASGNIAYNAARYDGGGIYLESESGNYNASARFTMSGGSISSNNADGNGKAVYVGYATAEKFAIFNISDSAKVATDNDVYLAGNIKISIAGAMTDNAGATITPSNYTEKEVLNLNLATYEYYDDEEGWIEEIVSPTTLEAEYQKFEVTPKVIDGYTTEWKITQEGKLLQKGFVSVPGTYFNSPDTVANSLVFIANREIAIQNLFACDHEVTQGEYVAVMGTNPSNNRSGDNYPVEKVSWLDAINYCNSRSTAENLTQCYTIDNNTNPATVTCNFEANGYRLPTEAEWEYLARGGNLTGVQTKYSGSDVLKDVAWYEVNSQGTIHLVKGKAPNNLGIYDMSGNVWEWCWDYYNSITSTTPATGPESANSNYHSERGGWYGTRSEYCEVANRQANAPTYVDSRSGFRVVRTVVSDESCTVNYQTSALDTTIASQTLWKGYYLPKPAIYKPGYEIEWYTNSDFSEEHKYDFSQPLTGWVTLYAKVTKLTSLHVKGGINPGSDTEGTGSAAHPFASISKAAEFINDAETDYTIMIDGKLAGTQEIPSAAQALSITINGENNGGIEAESTDDTYLLNLSATTPVTIKNLKIDGKQMAQCGINVQCEFTIETGTEILNNTHNGVSSRKAIIMNGGKIYNNGTLGSYNGGGVYIYASGSFTMTDGEISGNNAKSGGGIYMDGVTNGYISIENGSISRNHVTQSGGGIYSNSAGAIIIQGGTISENTITENETDILVGSGGGVYYNNGSGGFTMSNGTISGNKAATGGGVYLGRTLTMTGGTISENTANTGGAVYLSDNRGGLTMSDTAKIPFGVNGTKEAGKNDVYFIYSMSYPNTINVDGALSGDDIVATITTDYWHRGMIVLKSGSNLSGGITAEIAKRFAVSGPDDFTIKCVESKNHGNTYNTYNNVGIINAPIYVASADESKRKTCTGEPDAENTALGTKSNPLASMSQVMDMLSNSKVDKDIELTILVDGELIGENARFTNNTNSSALLLIKGANGDNTNDVLNANGASGSVITTSMSSRTMEIQDLKITGGYAENGGGINILNSTVRLAQGALVTGNQATSNGGGVYIDQGTLFMYSTAQIGENGLGVATSSSYSNCATAGGGVYNIRSSIYLGYTGYDSEYHPIVATGENKLTGGIYHNYANGSEGGDGGGIYNKSTVKMNSGNIAFNGSQCFGAGIASYESSSFEMSGGKISYNECYHYSNPNIANYGGGVRVGDNTTFNMTGGEICNNKADWGGGVSLCGTFTMTNGNINNNVAHKGSSSGVLYERGTFNMEGDAKIAANNDVYLSNGKSITILAPLTADTVAVVTPFKYEIDVPIIDTIKDVSTTSPKKECGRFFVTPQSGGTYTEWWVKARGVLTPHERRINVANDADHPYVITSDPNFTMEINGETVTTVKSQQVFITADVYDVTEDRNYYITFSNFEHYAPVLGWGCIGFHNFNPGTTFTYHITLDGENISHGNNSSAMGNSGCDGAMKFVFDAITSGSFTFYDIMHSNTSFGKGVGDVSFELAKGCTFSGTIVGVDNVFTDIKAFFEAASLSTEECSFTITRN